MSNPNTPENQDPSKLTNVHEALAEASELSIAASESMKNYSIRLAPSVRDLAAAICERNRTDLSTFFRECAKALIRDYGGKIDDQG